MPLSMDAPAIQPDGQYARLLSTRDRLEDAVVRHGDRISNVLDWPLDSDQVPTLATPHQSDIEAVLCDINRCIGALEDLTRRVVL